MPCWRAARGEDGIAAAGRSADGWIDVRGTRWGVTVGTTYAQRDELPLEPWPELHEMSRRVEVKLLPT